MMVKLGDIFKQQITGEWGTDCDSDELGIYVLRTTNFTSNGDIDYSCVVKRNIEQSKVEKKKLCFGDIILEKSGGTEKTPVGRVVYCDENINNSIYLCNNFTQAMRVNNDIAFSKYVFYFMWYLHLSGKTDLLQNKTTGIRNLQIKAYLKEDIPLPPLEEQRKIAETLDKVNNLITKRKQQLEKLDLLVKSKFVEMFGDCDNICRVSDVCKIITDGTHQPPQFVEYGIPFLFVSNVVTNKITYDTQKFISQETYDELIKRTPIEKNDILLSTVGSYGHAAIVEDDRKFLFQRHIAYLKPDNNIICSNYFHSALLSYDVQCQIYKSVKGIAQKTLNLSEIRKLKIPLPPIELQNQFADFVKQTEKTKTIIGQSLEKLETLKKALMQEYFG